MANGHVEIHDPFSNHNGLNGPKHCDHQSTSETDSMEDTVELRLLMAYAQRRRPKKETPTPDVNQPSSPQTPDKTEKDETTTIKKRKRKGWRRLPKFFSCISPRTGDDEPRQMDLRPSDVDDRCGDFKPAPVKEAGFKDKLDETATRLMQLADEIHFIPPDVETDSQEDANVEKMIGLLLRESGDRLNERELKDANIATELFWNYSFFRLLMTTLLRRMGLRTPDPESPGPKASNETQIAVTCEVTTRLSAVNSLPRKQLLDHGARYLQHYYSPWAQQQGGYEQAFYSDDEDDIQ